MRSIVFVVWKFQSIKCLVWGNLICWIDLNLLTLVYCKHSNGWTWKMFNVFHTERRSNCAAIYLFKLNFVPMILPDHAPVQSLWSCLTTLLFTAHDPAWPHSCSQPMILPDYAPVHSPRSCLTTLLFTVHNPAWPHSCSHPTILSDDAPVHSPLSCWTMLLFTAHCPAWRCPCSSV